MPTNVDPSKFLHSHKGWEGLTHTLAKTLPYQLTQGGNARKALYALMRRSAG